MNTKNTTESMKRGEFLRSLGLSSAALMSFYCMGTLTACSGDDDANPQPSAPNPPAGTAGFSGNADTGSGRIDFTLDLTSSTYQKLKTVGEFVTVGSLIVANVRGGRYVALSRACTHQGTTVQYRLNNDDFYCSNHGSEFRTDGTVEQGPATRALTLYRTELTANGNSLRVTE